MLNRLTRSLPGRVVGRYATTNAGTWATAIAWNLLFSFFPIALIVITVSGVVLSGPANAQLMTDLQHSLSGQGALLAAALTHFHADAGPLVIISVLGLVWSGTSLFGTINQALSAIRQQPARSFVSQRLMSIIMICVFTVLIIVAVSSSGLLAFTDRFSGAPAWFTHGPAALLLQILLGWVDFTMLLSAIYVIVPRQRPRLRAALIGAVVAGLALEGFTLLFPFYFRLEHGFSTYGSTFALFFLIMTYAYFLAQIILLGEALVAELDPTSEAPQPVAEAPQAARHAPSEPAA